MKSILFLFLVTWQVYGYSQNTYEIILSNTLDETRMGVWTTGEYKVYVDLNILETNFRQRGEVYLDGSLHNNNEDSLATICNLVYKRYLEAANQLKNAENGFNLRSLSVYYGPENVKENAGNSSIVEDIVRQLVENGMSVVLYKGTRVSTLKRHYEPIGEGLDFGYNVLIYFDEMENYIFKFHEHLGW